MKREIYEVTAKAVDASGGYNNLTGYPKSFDSHQNNDDLEKTKNKAYAAYDSAGADGYTAAANGRPLTIVSIVRMVCSSIRSALAICLNFLIRNLNPNRRNLNRMAVNNHGFNDIQQTS